MSAFVIVDIEEIFDPETYDAYKLLTPECVKSFGGSFFIRGAKTTSMEGEWNPDRFVILEFESGEKVKEWYNSEEYSKIKELRLKASKGRMILVEKP